MKIYHFVLIFLLFFIIAIVKTDVDTGKLKSIENEKSKLTYSLDTAASDTINYLSKTGAYGTNTINKTEVVNRFFTSFYTSLGIISDEAAKEEIEMYIPVILLCDSDGYYAYYYDEYRGNDGYTYTNRRWSEKMPYFYKDNNFVYKFTLSDTVTIYDAKHLLWPEQEVYEINYNEIQTEDRYQNFRDLHKDSILLKDDQYKVVKKEAIINQLEKVMSYYTSKHNLIAKNNGITYTFSFPAYQKGEWAEYIDDVNLIVVFQGYPYVENHNYTYNKIACACADVIKKEVYYAEKKGWYYLAHKAGCPKLAGNTAVLDKTFESLEDCAKLGAYCDDCIINGARVPKIE